VTELERPSLSFCDCSSITDSNLSRFGERSPPCEQSLVMHHVVSTNGLFAAWQRNQKTGCLFIFCPGGRASSADRFCSAPATFPMTSGRRSGRYWASKAARLPITTRPHCHLWTGAPLLNISTLPVSRYLITATWRRPQLLYLL
jgi:hypothetical protein